MNQTGLLPPKRMHLAHSSLTPSIIITHLPQILAFLEPKHVLPFSRINKTIHQILSNEVFWIPFIQRSFGSVKNLLYYRFHVACLLVGNRCGFDIKTNFVRFSHDQADIIQTVAQRIALYKDFLAGDDFQDDFYDKSEEFNSSKSKTNRKNHISTNLFAYQGENDAYRFNISTSYMEVKPSQEFLSKRSKKPLYDFSNHEVSDQSFSFGQDILSVILSYCDHTDLIKWIFVDKKWYQLLNQEDFCFQVLINAFKSVKNTFMFPKYVIAEYCSFKVIDNNLQKIIYHEDMETCKNMVLEYTRMDSIYVDSDHINWKTQTQNPVMKGQYTRFRMQDFCCVDIFPILDIRKPVNVEFHPHPQYKEFESSTFDQKWALEWLEKTFGEMYSHDTMLFSKAK